MENRLKEIINDRFKSQSHAAREMGLKRQQLNTVLNKGRFSVEFVLKLVEVVPDLNLNWLILDKGKKYLGEEDVLYDMVKEQMMNYGKREYDMISEMRDQVVYLRDQNKFLQDLVKSKSEEK